MTEFTQPEISTYYKLRVPGMPQPYRSEWRGKCPIHDGKDLNFGVNSETGFASCHSQCGRGWDMIGLEMELGGLDFPTAKAAVFEIVGRPAEKWEDRDIEAAYEYVKADGILSYQGIRKHGKKFSQRRPDGSGGWIYNLHGVELVPFRLPELLAASFVFVVEGEKDAINLSRLGVAATCNNGGAGNFKPDIVKYFAGKKVAILPDFDDPGRKHALAVAALLAPVTLSVKIVELPGLKPKGDVSDFIQAGGTLEQIRELYASAKAWTPAWTFASECVSEDDKYIHTIPKEVELAGGPWGFWDLVKQQGIPTPWPKLTQALGGGLRKGEVYVIGGNQGSGKTSMALQFAIKTMRSGKGVLYFSMEMGARDVFQRMASIESLVNLADFREAQSAAMSIDAVPMRDLLIAMTAELARYSLTVSTKSGVTPQYLLDETTRLRSKAAIELVVIDHMQLMGSAGNSRGDYEKFTAISRMTKEVAVTGDVPVLLVSQTSRGNTSDKRTELEPSDLRGSGAIEEDAAAVMLVYPDSAEKERTIAEGTFQLAAKSWLKIGKNRYGPQGSYLPMMHMKTCTRFDPYQTDDGSM